MKQPRLGAAKAAAGFGFLEGPRFRDGYIYTSDHQRCEVFRIDVASAPTALASTPPTPLVAGWPSLTCSTPVRCH